MTKRTITTWLLLVGCVTAFAGEQTSAPDSSAEATIRALDDQERLAALHQDYAALELLWSEHFIVNAPSNQVMPNRSAVLDWFRKGMTARSSYERSIEQVRVDGDIAVVMGAETLTRITDFTDRTTAILFADGAGAVVLGASEEPGIISTHLHADGSYRDLLCDGHPSVWYAHVTADPELIRDRMSHRTGHYMPVSLLDSQLALLEPLDADEPGIRISGAGTPDAVVDDLLTALNTERGVRIPDRETST